MNATSLYVSTSRLVLQNEGEHNQNWTDLYRLIPYLRQSLSCAVCSNLLMEPYTPTKLHCQHHVCKQCIRRRRNMKPLCPFCKDCESYNENMQLRILLQCYKRLCEHILTIPMYNTIKRQKQGTLSITSGKPIVNSSLVDFIEEGATFQDNFKCNSGLKRSDYSILPCVFARTDVKVPLIEEPPKDDLNQLQNCNIDIVKTEANQPVNLRPPPIKTVSNGSAMYSVLYTGIGNKITIKRKVESDEESNVKELQTAVNSKTIAKRRGCRCGNAAITPGKLTCCGQRCPCYVESKSCFNCKCRGCRNPHRPDGGKIRPHIPELACYEIQVADENTSSPISMTTTPSDFLQIPLQNYNPSNRIVREVPIIKSAHQQTCSIIDNMARESYIVAEGSIEVNVFTSQTRSHNNQVEQDAVRSRNIQTRPELHQIVMEAKETSNIIVHQNDRSQHNASIFMSPDSTPSITLSPIIVTTSSSVPCQIFSQNEIMTSCPTPPARNPTLVDFVLASNESNIQNNLHFQ